MEHSLKQSAIEQVHQHHAVKQAERHQTNHQAQEHQGWCYLLFICDPILECHIELHSLL